jgi:hypothetical protein
MDVNEQSFQLIADYLNHTLSPDPNVRRPGKFNFYHNHFFRLKYVNFFF